MKPRWSRRRRILAVVGVAIVAVTLWRVGGGRASDNVESAINDVQVRAASVTIRWLGVQPTDETFGIKLFYPDHGDEPADGRLWRTVKDETPRRIVLLLHGLDEPGQIFNDLAPALSNAGYDVARFDYPNDQSPARSAELLGEELVALHALGTEHIDLIAHSMGGLVARDALTRDSIYGGNGEGGLVGSGDGGKVLPEVDRLILVGTPNLGSPWARLRAIGEIREQIVRYRESESYDPRQLVKFLSDGLGDAGTDLLPGSDYLKELNGRPLPEGIAITTIIGEIATTEGPELAWVSDSKVLRTLLGNKHMTQLVDSIDEMLTGIGDGVVTARSAKLAGVDDAPVVTASHRGMLLAIGAEKLVREALTGEVRPPPAIEIILDRLGKTEGDG